MDAPSLGGWNETKSTDNNGPADFDGSGLTLYRFYNTDYLFNDFFTDGKYRILPYLLLDVYEFYHYHQQRMSVL